MHFVIMVAISIVVAFSATAAETVSGAGRIEYGENGKGCSAALVRPDLVVTAAHCAMGTDRPANAFFRRANGGEGEKYPIDLIVRHPLYDRDSPRQEWRYRFDIAVARLARPVPDHVAQPFPGGDVAVPGETLYIVSWRGGEQPRQRGCPVIEGVITGLVTLGCRVQGGESGAPVLRKTDGGLKLVAVISSRANILKQPVAQASDVLLRLPPLFDIVDRAQP